MNEAAPFSDLVAHRAFLRNLARALVHDGHAAEDVAQDTLLQALEAHPSGLRSPRAWLAQIARRGALRWRRREEDRPVRERRAARPEAVEDRSERDLALQHDVLDSVRALDPIYRSAIFLRFYEDRSPSRIAEELGVPLSTVKTRLQRGLARLRDELDRKHGGQRGAWLAPLALFGAPSGIGVHASVPPLVISALGLLMKKIVIAACVLLALGLGSWMLLDLRDEEDSKANPLSKSLSADASNASLAFSVSRETVAASEASVTPTPVIQEPPASPPPEEKPAAGVDLRPRNHAPGHVLVTLGGDRYLNPDKREFTPDEKAAIQKFAMEDGLLYQQLEQSFHAKLQELGKQFLSQGRATGSVDESTLTRAEIEKLPYLTEDWLNPIFIEWQGRQRTWVQIDLKQEAPDLARLREDGWAESAAARARLRDFISRMPRH